MVFATKDRIIEQVSCDIPLVGGVFKLIFKEIKIIKNIEGKFPCLFVCFESVRLHV